MNPQIGEMISHYRTIEEIGQGGMGVVYKAEDTKLKRMVALKFLPPDLSRDAEARDRFIQEAQAASALQHNNICTVHDIDRTGDGQMFIVMDLYTGETLREKIARGSLAFEEAVDIAVQIGQGLARAHERGIVHRDIKPANIFVTDDGTVKILDFGLAKLGAGANLTRVGTTLGTAAYMSPEQANGEDVDSRTDIWSLGVVFYQMLTGRLPFSAGHDLALIYSIQNSDPPPLPSSGIPAECQQFVTTVLKKNPDARYQHVSEFVANLRTLKTGTPPGATATGMRPAPPAGRRTRMVYGSIAIVLALLIVGFFLLRRHADTTDLVKADTPVLRRIAVLPFTNLRSDPETDFLGFALADQIIGNLSYLKNLVVRPSSAIRKYQNEAVDLISAGQNLNVDLILTGNYQKESNIIRLSLELADVHTNAILWRQAMQEKYENAFKLEDTVARKVVDGLRVQFSPEELHQMRADVSRNPLAYEYYLRGISYPVTLEGNRHSISMLRQSIGLDSTFAPAFNELGYRLWQLATYAGGQQELAQSAESAFLKALALNGALLSAHGNLISAYTELGRTEEAYETAQKILAINPNSPDGHFFLGYICRYAGFLVRAEQEMEKALSLDPNNPRFRSIGITYVYLGKYQQALGGYDLDSASTFSLSWKAHTYILAGQPERAVHYLDRVLATEPESRFGVFCQEMKLYLDRRYDLLPAVMRKSEEAGEFDGESWYNLAEQYGRFNESTGVARTLQRAIDSGFFNYPLMLRDPLLDTVRGNTNVQRAMATAKTKYEAFRARHPELQEEK